MIFTPTYIKDRVLCESCELLQIETDDGVKLEGAVYEPLNATKTLLVFVGRSHDAVALMHKLAQTYLDCRIVAFNYRGYGRSGGLVNEKNIKKDGLQIAALIQKHYGDFFLLGFSLGSSVAAYIASHHKVKSLFLVGAFDSLNSLVEQKFYRFKFISKSLRYKFQTAKYMKDVDTDTYLFVSRDDEITYIYNARELKKSIKNLVYYDEIEGITHNELLWNKQVTNKINKVIKNG
jgi:pimeloyl-ACP methyl ester carboxylesterase